MTTGERYHLVLPGDLIDRLGAELDQAYPGVELYRMKPAGLEGEFVRILGEKDPHELELEQGIARNAAFLRVFEAGGGVARLTKVPGQPGEWWRVPGDLVETIGCQMARVA